MEKPAFPPEIDPAKCISCGLCLEVCPAFVIEMANEKAAVVRGDWCIGCGQCGVVCPTEAILPEGAGDETLSHSGIGAGASSEALQLLFRERRSVRRYQEEPVPKEMLERIVDAGRYAPTGKNSQNVNYVVLTSSDEIGTLREMMAVFYEKLIRRVRGPVGSLVLSLAAGRKLVESLRESIPKVEHAKKEMEQGKDPLFYHAPVVMLVHAESWDTCSAFNCSTTLYNCSLMAHTLGIGCCFNGYLSSAANHDRKIKSWLGIPKDHQCFAAMTLGYRKVKYQRLPDRKPPTIIWR
jgi:nitroreductase/NAD-dependent dihydropyrimidine dehydrogenase PreA subunit